MPPPVLESTSLVNSGHPPVRFRFLATGYIVGLLALCVAALLRFGFAFALEDRARYLPFIVAVVVVSWFGGMLPTLATAAGAVLIQATIDAAGDDRTFNEQLSDLASACLFLLSSVAIALIDKSRRQAWDHAAERLDALRFKSNELEAEIALRREVDLELRNSQQDLIRHAQELSEAQRVTSESLALLDALIGNAPIGLAFFDAQLRFARINAALASFNRKPIDEHLDRTVHDVLPSEGQELADCLHQVLATGEPILDRRIESADPDSPGGRRHWLASYYPVPGAGADHLIGVGAIVQDITERTQLEAKLRDREDRFRNLAEAMPQLVWMTRTDGIVEFMNQRWFSYTGMSREDSLGEGWLHALHPDDLDRTTALWNRCVEFGEPYEIEYRFRSASGQFRWFLGRGLPLRDSEGQIQYWIGTCTDIDDFKTAQEELRRSEERFRVLSETLPHIIWTANPAGEIEHFNARWYAYTGFSPAASLGRAWKDAVHPEEVPEIRSAWHAAVDEGVFVELEYRLRRYDGAYRWHVARAVPLRGLDGQIVQWVGSVTDIDDRRRQSETLERLVRERTCALERSNRDLEQFAYVASHDLQEPLRKIQAFGDRLARHSRENLGETAQDYLDRILASATRMRGLINDLLAFSRVATRRQPFAAVNLGAIVEEVLSDLEESLIQSGGVVAVGPMPTIEADPLQVRQLFQNLIANALKFHKLGEPPRVEISASPSPTEVADVPTWRITVRDEGIGFEPEYTHRLFQVFQRLHTRQQYEGTGVGLAICQKIVERHHGRIEAIGSPGAGATFVITLPASQQAMAEAS